MLHSARVQVSERYDWHSNASVSSNVHYLIYAASFRMPLSVDGSDCCERQNTIHLGLRETNVEWVWPPSSGQRFTLILLSSILIYILRVERVHLVMGRSVRWRRLGHFSGRVLNGRRVTACSGFKQPTTALDTACWIHRWTWLVVSARCWLSSSSRPRRGRLPSRPMVRCMPSGLRVLQNP